MKQRILLIVALLLIATPALATVTINVVQGSGSDVNKVYVGYVTTGDAVRAFALDFTLADLSPRAQWAGIQDFNRGESTTPGGGYGIFPGQFRNNINPADPNWNHQYYYPVAPPNDVDSNDTGIGTRKVICELGTLYTGANAPGTSGRLFTLVVDNNTQSSVGLTVATNTVRGGVVLEDGSSPTPTINNLVANSGNLVFGPIPPAAPATITVPASDADGKYVISWSAVTEATSYVLESSAPASGTTIFPLWVQCYSGSAVSFNEAVGGGTWSYRVKAVNASGESAWTTGANNCVAANCLIGGVAGTAENPDWVKWRYPAGWCYARQCRGDINGKVAGPQWVQALDFTAFVAAYGKTDVQLAAVPNGINADLNHKKSGPQRVQSLDFTILTTYYGKSTALVPLCTAAPIINGPWNYNTVPY